jgi:hypothetical protein
LSSFREKRRITLHIVLLVMRQFLKYMAGKLNVLHI